MLPQGLFCVRYEHRRVAASLTRRMFVNSSLQMIPASLVASFIRLQYPASAIAHPNWSSYQVYDRLCASRGVWKPQFQEPASHALRKTQMMTPFSQSVSLLKSWRKQ